MVDRIEKTTREYWQVHASSETKRDKKREGKSQEGQDSQDSFGETSDFVQLLSKDPRRYRSQKLDSNQISSFTYRGMSTHREKAILEVDISLTDGTLVKGAQVALSREEGMKFLSRCPGDSIVVDQLVKGTIITVAFPEKVLNPSAKQGVIALGGEATEATTGLGWYYYLGFGALLLAVLLLVYLFFAI